MCLKQIEGRTGEELASKYLESLGYKIICNNFRCTQGEIDVIAQDKIWRGKRSGKPKEAKAYSKCSKILFVQNKAGRCKYKNWCDGSVFVW